MEPTHVHQQGMLVIKDSRTEMLLLAKTNGENWLRGVEIDGHPRSVTCPQSESCIVISIEGCVTPLVIDNPEVASMLATWIEHAAEWLAFIASSASDEEDEEDEEE